MNNDLTDVQNIPNDPLTVIVLVETPSKKTVTEAALEANRAKGFGAGPLVYPKSLCTPHQSFLST